MNTRINISNSYINSKESASQQTVVNHYQITMLNKQIIDMTIKLGVSILVRIRIPFSLFFGFLPQNRTR